MPSTRTNRQRFLLAAAGSAALLLGSSPANAQSGLTQVIVTTGQTVPGGNGRIGGINGLTLNDAGQVAFFALLTATSGLNDDSGIFLGSGGTVTQIARRGQTVPGGNGTYSVFAPPAINEAGQVAFFVLLTGSTGGATDNEGIFLGSGGTVTQIAREGQTVPGGNGTYGNMTTDPAFNDAGQVAFVSTLTGTSGGNTDNDGLFRGEGGTVTQIARKGQTVPGGNGSYLDFFRHSLNDAGQVVFIAPLTGTSGGTTDNQGIFRGSGGTVTQIARKGQTVPGGNGTYSSFLTSSVLNDAGQVAFLAPLTGTSGGSADNSGLFLGSGGTVAQIAREGQTVPGGNGTYLIFEDLVLNDAGQVAFSAVLTGTSGGNTDNEGIFRGSGGTVTQIARKGQTVPGGNGTYSSFINSTALNDAGLVAFNAFLTGTSGGSADNEAIYLSDGIDTVQAARRGDTLAGAVVVDVISQFNLNSGTSGRESLNGFGQVVYIAARTLAGSVIATFTPDLRYRSVLSGSFDTGSNWTLSLAPGDPHDVTIAPAGSLTVTKSSGTTDVRRLHVGGGTGIATLTLSQGGQINVAEGLTVLPTGVLTGDGVVGGSVTNNGEIRAQNLTITGVLTNNGDILGSASTANRISAQLNNLAAGEIRVAAAQSLRLTGPSHTNAGRVEVLGGSFEVAGAFTNAVSTGLITGRDAVLRFNSGLSNFGGVSLSSGFNDVTGDINNRAGSTLTVTGGAHATFYDDVIQNGTLRVTRAGTTTSVAVFLGSFSGAGGATGGGDVFLEGDLRPGNSPAFVTFGVNLTLSPSTTTLIEIAGTADNTYDRVSVSGVFQLDGTLDVQFIGGFLPAGGAPASFRILEAAALVGDFDQILLPTAGDRQWFLQRTATTLTVSSFVVIPEPASAAPLLAALPFLSRRRR